MSLPSSPAILEFLARIPLFRGVHPDAMPDLLGILDPVELQPGEVLFEEGEPGSALWLLDEDTEVSISLVPPGGGAPLVVARARRGEAVGEMALVDRGPRSATARVSVPGPAYRLDAAAFQALRDALVPAAFQVLRHLSVELSARLRRLTERLSPEELPAAPPVALPRATRPEVAQLEVVPAFRELPESVKVVLARNLDLLAVGAGTALCAEGATADGAFFLLEGSVAVSRGGRRLGTLEAGSMLGQVACIDRGPRSATCTTTTPAVLLHLSTTVFDTLFDAGNRFVFRLVEHVAVQLVTQLRQANQLLPSSATAAAPVLSASRAEAMLMELDLELSELVHSGELRLVEAVSEELLEPPTPIA